MTSLYHGYNMAQLNQYQIKCKNCPKFVNVFKVDPSKPHQPKNKDKYYYSCKETNGIYCNYFRWFEHKWPKVMNEFQNGNSTEGTADTSPLISNINIDQEMNNLVSQLESVELLLLESDDISEIKQLTETLENKIKNSKLPVNKKTPYLQYLNNIKSLF